MRDISMLSWCAKAAIKAMRACAAGEGSGTASILRASALIIRTEVPSASAASWAWVAGALMYQQS